MKFDRTHMSVSLFLDAAKGEVNFFFHYTVDNFSRRYPDMVWTLARRNSVQVSRIVCVREFKEIFAVLVFHQQTGKRASGNFFLKEWLQVECFHKSPRSWMWQSEPIYIEDQEAREGWSTARCGGWQIRFDTIVSARQTKKGEVTVRLRNSRWDTGKHPYTCRKIPMTKYRHSFEDSPSLKVMKRERKAKTERADIPLGNRSLPFAAMVQTIRDARG